MPTPPTHSGPVKLSDWTTGTAPVVLRKSPLTLNGDFGSGWNGTIDYLIDAKDIYSFCQFCGGNPYTVTPVGGGTAVRYIPLSHPDAPALLCTGIRATAIGGYTATNSETLKNWSHARVSLTFTSVPYLVDGSVPFMVTETRAGAEVYTLAGSKLTFPSDGTPIQTDAGLTVPTVVYSGTIYLTAGLNDTVLNPLLGCVNNAVFLGQPAGTMRFDSYSSQSSVTAGGTQAYTRTLFITFRPVEWNKFLRPNAVWEYAQKPDASHVYTEADLSPLVA